MARSVVDYLARWMASKFLSEEDQRTAGVLPMAGGVVGAPAADEQAEAPEDQLSFSATVTEGNGTNGRSHAADAGGPAKPRLTLDSTGQICSSCGSSDMVRAGTCLTCRTCGATSGCG
jgi:ribonucleoside-diphosphate reductase alpha chain